ncbi:MAG: deoxyribodipyrimidine photo-lyase [Bacteroidales bacterium]|jgi:deoxyribodipyrimidine photo-lyase|nr:deoxyribodipyrimidine photo-lyase [Bacteroidales bacterium]MDY0198222.1 deoxyribodipyrimidine photo-lyase [Tenuifilaceae bacterium]
MVNPHRVFVINQNQTDKKGPVVYWMSRDQRVHDNWALLFAANKANELLVPLHIVFTLAPNFVNANARHYDFLLKGLHQVEKEVNDRGASFHLLLGDPPSTLNTFINEKEAALLVSDFDPLRVKQTWKSELSNNLAITHIEVDAHNIVPCRFVSQKVEFAAYTLRPKLKRLLPEFLTEFPKLPILKVKLNNQQITSDKALSWLNFSTDVAPVNWLKPGFYEASKMLESFIQHKLNGYSSKRNDPLENGQSNLSPYLHFGHISAQRVAIEVTSANAPIIDKEAFLDELVVRRELSDNFCFYNNDYDTPNGFHNWAKVSLAEHANDEREYTYSLAEFENAKTHDDLWNAAQLEMVLTGKMHGYMRMYWAKKILEWTQNIAQAMEFAVYLNDKYSLDGRDPNGYAGIAWSIGGVHDRAWNKRPIFGKIRFMNYNGCKRKFDIAGYMSRMKELSNKQNN